MHSRRALLYVPGDDRHKIEKSLTFGVDCLCFDLEDGVAQNRKSAAREVLSSALHELAPGPEERLARINPVGSGLEDEDVAAVLSCHPDGIILPKVESYDQLQWLSGKIEAVELSNGWPLNSMRLLAGIESAKALVSLKEIADHPRLDGLIFGGEDLAANIGAVRTPEAWELFTARSMVVLHARAFGLQAIDMVTVEYRDLGRVRSEAAFGAGLGYTGKQVIHPAQVKPVQTAFTPDNDAIEKARKLVEAFEIHVKEGKGTFGLDGRMIDLPLVKAAQNVLEQARAAGIL